MNDSTNLPAILIAGPTATGKTDLAVDLARQVGGEVISADSMQVYRGCAIGTAQPRAAELGGVSYHLVGCIAPDAPWSVADWLRATLKLIDEIRERGHTPIIAGGTGLYFKALVGGLFQPDRGAGRDPALRARLEAEWDADGGMGLRHRLEAVDPEAVGRVHPNDRVRTVRALEVFENTGQPISRLQEEARNRHQGFRACRIVLAMDRAELYRRIDLRVERMLEDGFVDEVQDLLDGGAALDWPAMRALGYSQVASHLNGEFSLEQAIEETQRLSRNYAKQQLVLFRNWPGSVWLDAMDGIQRNRLNIEIILEFFRRSGI